jgi:hypothetical protein
VDEFRRLGDSADADIAERRPSRANAKAINYKGDGPVRPEPKSQQGKRKLAQQTRGGEQAKERKGKRARLQ